MVEAVYQVFLCKAGIGNRELKQGIETGNLRLAIRLNINESVHYFTMYQTGLHK